MGKGKMLFILLLVFGISSCWGSGSPSIDDQNLAIHTWGGGQLFKSIFQAVSMLVYGSEISGIGQTFTGILRVAMVVGALCSLSMAFSKSSFEPLLKNFFFPCTLVMCCILIPRSTVYIKDHLIAYDRSAKNSVVVTVSNVPFVLAKVTSVISTVSFYFTHALESVTHGNGQPSPNEAEQNPDTMYNWTGHIYAADDIFRTKKCRIANPVLEDNFREFCRECVFRDLGIGIYSKEELLHTKNILQFLAEHTSRIRTCYYRDTLDKEKPAENAKPEKNPSAGKFLPCNEAISRMNAIFDNPPDNSNIKNILVGEIGDDFKFLLKKTAENQDNLKNLIKQQMAINILKEEVPGTLNSFAAKRAELLQKENQKTLGALATITIVKMHNFFEACLYMIFPLIVIYSLLSFGLQKLLIWAQLILWVNSWPVLYVVIKICINTEWMERTTHMFGNKPFDLTIFTSEGLVDLYSSMESFAGGAMVLVPILSWFLIQGGGSQIVSLASTMMSPAQSAASTIAAETTYGNYSSGNVNLDNLNANNAQTFRQTYSGLLSTDSVSLDSGTETMTYATNDHSLYIKQTDSYLREGISRTQSFNNAVQDSFSSSQSALAETSKGYSENLSDSTNKGVGLVQAISKNVQTGENFNLQDTSGVQYAAQSLQGISKDYAQAQGIGNDQALSEVLSAGINGSFDFGKFFGIRGGVEGSYRDGVSASETENISNKAYDSDTIQKHIQTLTNASSGEIASILKGEDARLHEDFVRSMNTTATSSDQLRAAYTEHEALSNLKTYTESDNFSIHHKLDQRFVDFLTEKFQDRGRVDDILKQKPESSERHELSMEFAKDFFPRNSINHDVQDSYNKYASDLPTIAPDTFTHDKKTIMTEGEQKIGHSFGEIQKQADDLKAQVDLQSQHYINAYLSDSDVTKNSYDLKQLSSETALNQSIGSHFWDKATSVNTIRSTYNALFGSENNTSQPSE